MAKLDITNVRLLADHNTPIEMRDGTVLRADVYRHADGAPVPVLLIRNPYGEQMLRGGAPVIPAIDAGFAVVVQNCRGTGTSDGELVPFENEAADGVDTIEWCARQPWCDGAVVMLGASYLGMVQLAAAVGPGQSNAAAVGPGQSNAAAVGPGQSNAAAVDAPDALRGLVAIVTPADYHWGLAYRQGALQLGQLFGWHMLKSGQELAYRAAAGQDVSAELAELFGPTTGYTYLPLREMPGVSRILPSWQRWLDHEERDSYWSGLSYSDARDRVTAPVLHIGGWFDLFLGGTLDNFVSVSRSAATTAARAGQRLIVGPWTHIDRTGMTGELNFGPGASEQAIGLEQVQMAFLRTVAGGGEPAGPRVKLFVMGDNVWRDEDDWPLARTQWTRWYLRVSGSLSRSEPAKFEPPSHYTHDPRDPVPTVGGAILIGGGPDGGITWMPGPRDQRAVEARPDVLSFTSEPLTEDLEVTGPVSVTLCAATSAADTDFAAKLVDVWPDGRALYVTDGIVRARYRGGSDLARPIQPGEVYEYTIDLIATSQVFKAGHRLRVDVASSNFPCFDRNPGNGAPAATATEADFVVAGQTIYHDGEHQSFISLPVIPR